MTRLSNATHDTTFARLMTDCGLPSAGHQQALCSTLYLQRQDAEACVPAGRNF